MKLLVVTYRWGREYVGGAEIHLRRLVLDLAAMGHEVVVWTTTGRNFQPAAHWGVDWVDPCGPFETDDEGVPVRYFALDATHRKIVQMTAKLLQRRIEQTWEHEDSRPLARIAARQPEAQRPWVHLLDHWHPVEVAEDGSAVRWTSRASTLAVYPVGAKGRLWITGHARRKTSFVVRDGAGHEQPVTVEGDYDVCIPIARGDNEDDVITIVSERPWRPLTDHRTLGLYVRSVRWQPEGTDEPVEADLWQDGNAIGRRDSPGWYKVLDERTARRTPFLCNLFDRARGPQSHALARTLRKPPEGFDAVLAANLPWNIIPMVARECPLPLLAMPLWHLEDDYYWWPHYIEALRQARLVLANTEYAATQFYAPRGIAAEFVGPGIAVPGSREVDPAAWRERIGLARNTQVVLCVCRKSPEKRYDVVAEAVERLARAGRDVVLVLIGPDADRRAVPASTRYLGRVEDDELDEAYRACDVFAFLSDSESFGMVLVEAWMRGKPVIANRRCGPTASLVREGVDGLLADGAAETAGAIARLLDNPDEARRLGEAGRDKALREFTQRAATQRFLAAAQRVLGLEV